MKQSEDYLYDRNIELNERLWAQERMTQILENELTIMLETLKDINKLNSLGKTKEIADIIRVILKSYNYEKRLSARIHNLKSMGYRITSTTKTNPKTKKKYASYSIY